MMQPPLKRFRKNPWTSLPTYLPTNQPTTGNKSTQPRAQGVRHRHEGCWRLAAHPSQSLQKSRAGCWPAAECLESSVSGAHCSQARSASFDPEALVTARRDLSSRGTFPPSSLAPADPGAVHREPRLPQNKPKAATHTGPVLQEGLINCHTR